MYKGRQAALGPTRHTRHSPRPVPVILCRAPSPHHTPASFTGADRRRRQSCSIRANPNQAGPPISVIRQAQAGVRQQPVRSSSNYSSPLSPAAIYPNCSPARSLSPSQLFRCAPSDSSSLCALLALPFTSFTFTARRLQPHSHPDPLPTPPTHILHRANPPATVKLDSLETPPPLCYSPITSDRGRESTADTTPISTPVEQQASPHFGRQKKDRDLYFSWHRKPHELGSAPRQLLEPDLLFEDAGDCSFPLFPESPPRHDSLRDMAQAASPIDITPPRFNSSSPQNQTSNLTFALREAGATRDLSITPNQQHAAGVDFLEGGRPSISGRHGSVSNGLGSSFYGSGARPISMKDRPRRESNTMGSFAGGMSWGGVSVGSWIRDE